MGYSIKNQAKLVEFNPASRDQCAKVLKQYGWEPEDFSPAGKPKVDETTLATITDNPEGKDPMLVQLATIMGEYFLLIKRLGQLGDGKQAWLKVERGGAFMGLVIRTEPSQGELLMLTLTWHRFRPLVRPTEGAVPYLRLQKAGS